MKTDRRHDCSLPRFIGTPVALDPRTDERAKPGLRLRCTTCGQCWYCKPHRMQDYRLAIPDLTWEKTRLRWGALDFDAAVYYSTPHSLVRGGFVCAHTEIASSNGAAAFCVSCGQSMEQLRPGERSTAPIWHPEVRP